MICVRAGLFRERTPTSSGQTSGLVDCVLHSGLVIAQKGIPVVHLEQEVRMHLSIRGLLQHRFGLIEVASHQQSLGQVTIGVGSFRSHRKGLSQLDNASLRLSDVGVGHTQFAVRHRTVGIILQVALVNGNLFIKFAAYVVKVAGIDRVSFRLGDAISQLECARCVTLGRF